MNINDLKPSEYQVTATGAPLNINSLPQGSYTTAPPLTATTPLDSSATLPGIINPIAGFGGVGINSPTGDFATGFAKNFAQIPFNIANIGKGIANTVSKIPGLGWLGTKQGSPADVSTQVPQALQPTNTTQQLGSAAADVAQIAAPTGLVSDVQEGLKGMAGASRVGQFASHVLPEAAFGGAYGAVKSGGDPTATAENALGFGIFSSLFYGVGQAYQALKGGLGDNIGRALGLTGKTSDLTQRIAKAADGLKVIADNATGATVKDINGAEHAFDPSKATFFDTIQAWKSAASKVYKQYTDLATQAGDQGAQFTQGSFSKVFDTLDGIVKNETTPYANKASEIKSDILRIFGENIKNGISLTRIQDLIEKINKDVNPNSNAAAADVSQRVSQTLRGMMDDKITSATGEGYQNLRNQYAALKSIENDLMNQAKKAVRGTSGNLSSIIQGVSTIESLVSVLTNGPADAIKWASAGTVAKILENLKDPEANLQRAFRAITNPEDMSPTAQRVFGSPQTANPPTK